MKKNIGLIILIIIMCAIASFLAYTIVSKQNISKEEFNIKKGDILTFKEYDTSVRILNIASLKSIDPKKEKDIEVSLEVTYKEKKTNYTLNNSGKEKERIKESNNYIVLEYKDNKIIINIKDKNEINN